MVWIYGGGWTSGSGTWQEYGPGKFIDEDVVMVWRDFYLSFSHLYTQVSFNYRLGALGWFYLGAESEVEGNQGLHDMVAALQWVQANIALFGGDPDQVTIFGESAGSWASSYLSVSPLAAVKI